MSRVLIIDDNDSFRSLLASALVNAGYEVSEAATGEKGIAAIRENPPDLVLTDIVMPDQDGVGVAMVMRDEIPNIPLIAMSGNLLNSSFYLQMVKKLGARTVLEKPFKLEEMLEVVATALKESRL